MSLIRMILYSKLKNGLWKIVTKSQVVTKFNVTVIGKFSKGFGKVLSQLTPKISYMQQPFLYSNLEKYSYNLITSMLFLESFFYAQGSKGSFHVFF